ncbi:MAG: hypothetical protein WCT03_26800 [Candidatus Obscuribacterales bacterium]|jgi:hypothetical protein
MVYQISMTDEESTAGSDFAALQTIGTCYMAADGALILKLRATEGPGGVVGTATVTYECAHPAYLEILEHVKPIVPGQTKAVAPWPD